MKSTITILFRWHVSNNLRTCIGIFRRTHKFETIFVPEMRSKSIQLINRPRFKTFNPQRRIRLRPVDNCPYIFLREMMYFYLFINKSGNVLRRVTYFRQFTISNHA